ncbi:MAG: hypothetical protein A2505_06040 [Deltaproteobacteria bacterium RIFOXYD12_FULL_55_16]|nr:MAG: hypothetical protein A2505_06040 [Deltaproteobacteria bacterium RIFOXYD12_FULL_55_16]
MLSFYKKLPISAKLLLSNLAFALPMAVLIFFMNISFIYDINIGKKELAGSRNLRRLFTTLQENSGVNGQEKTQAQILEQFLATGRDFLLTRDPALDSSLLAGILVAQLPRNYSQLSRYSLPAHPAARPGTPAAPVEVSRASSLRLQHDFSLFQADFAKIITDAGLAVQEDGNYYGTSPSLHDSFARAMEDYRRDTARFIALQQQSATGDVDRAAYLATGEKARASCRRLIELGFEELDILIGKRIASYRTWQLLAFVASALALALASAFIYAIAKSITDPIKAIIGYTRQISNGAYLARLNGDFQGELKGLATDLKAMVHEIIRLAAFPRENPNPVLASAADGAITYMNHSAKAILEELRLGGEDFLPPDHGQIIEACLASGRNRSGIESPAGEKIFEWNYHPLAEQGMVHIYAKDITARKMLEEQLRREAFHDSLTGLANRALFLDRLQQAVARRKSDPQVTFTVLFLDLDGFKLVNDSLGHEQGDKLLIAFAERIAPIFHPGDTVARLAGDEFTVLLDNISTQQSLAMPERIQQTLVKSFPLGGLEIAVSVSIGIVIQPAPELDAEEILRDADTAMYRAKAQGRGQYVLFDSTMHSQALQRLRLEIELKKALEWQEFVVFYQPIVDLANGRLIGFEALVRWQHPEQGLVPPMQFIPLAEKTGLILAIGREVLRVSCLQAKAWQEKFAGHRNLLLSVNLAVPQLLSPRIMTEIDQILEQSGLPSATLKLEITESGLMENIDTALDVLHAIKQRGITLSIDDFGTGYSSLSYLHRFPFDTLKVDRSFVIEMEKDTKNLEIIRSIVALAHSLEKKIIVEGIETATQLALVQALGCEFGQGYFFAKPLPADEAEKLLRSAESFF